MPKDWNGQFGGDTGIDADFAPYGYVCHECSDDIEVGEEVELKPKGEKRTYMYCPECAEELKSNKEAK